MMFILSRIFQELLFGFTHTITSNKGASQKDDQGLMAGKITVPNIL